MTTGRKMKQQRAPRITGICTAAAYLGVSRQHLHAVLSGRRASKSLTKRYQAFNNNQH